MDAQEIEHTRRDEQQWIDRSRIESGAIPIVELRHCIGNEVRGQRLEAEDCRSVGPRFGDVVVGGLPASATARYELKQIAMQLQYEIRRELHVGGIRVDGVQDIAVSGDLLFGAVRRLGALANQIADALRRRHHTLDPV